MEYIRVKNWDKFQHYRRPNPVWIKVYHRLLEDYEFTCLSIKNRCLLLEFLLLAAKHENKVPNDQKYLRAKLSWPTKVTFTELISKDFLEFYNDSRETLDKVYTDSPRSFSVSYKEYIYFKEHGVHKNIVAFVAMRKDLKKPINEVAYNRLVNRHKKLVAQGHDPAELIDLATAQCWLSFYPPKETHEAHKRTGHKTVSAGEQNRIDTENYFRGLSKGDSNTLAKDV